MHLRRAVLLFALILGLAALVAAVSPSRQTSGPAQAPPATGAGGGGTAGVERHLAFTAGARRVRRVREGEHLIVSVADEAGGVATIPRLGLTASVAPSAPAQFDLLAPAPGSYDVVVSASDGSRPRRAGTIVTRP